MIVKIIRNIFLLILLLAALAFIIRFSGGRTLKLYVEAGFGDCLKNPILCLIPAEEIKNPEIDREFIAALLPQRFADMQVSIPKGFTVVKEKIKKVYYKKHKRNDKGAVAYLLYQPPKFFINLFPQVVNEGITQDYDFLSRTMSADPGGIKKFSDAFFVIMKGVFIPDLGSQKNVRIVKFAMPGKKGFISYNFEPDGHYFNCDIIDQKGNFFKLYLKDPAKTLDLDKMLAIVSTVRGRE